MRIGLTTLLMVFALGSAAMADSACHSQAIGKDGRPLAGAALNSLWRSVRGMHANPKRSEKMENLSLVPRRLAS
jgi:hypothetical protein